MQGLFAAIFLWTSLSAVRAARLPLKEEIADSAKPHRGGAGVTLPPPPPLPAAGEDSEGGPAATVERKRGRRPKVSRLPSPLSALKSSSGTRGQLPPGLAELLKKAYSKPGLKGDILYTARKHCAVKFSLDNYDHLKPSDVVMAQVHLYQVKPRRALQWGSREGRVPIRHARVSVHEVTQTGRRHTSITRVLDSKLVTLGDSGWVSFDITTAIQGWLKKSSTNKGLEVWVESTQPGKQAAKVARKVRFVKPSAKNLRHRPALVMYFKSQNSTL